MFLISHQLLSWLLRSLLSQFLRELLIKIEIKNNKARHNLSNVKYRQMAFRLVDSAIVGSFLEPLGQTKVMHSHQREIT